MNGWRGAAACAGVGPEVFFDPTPAAVRRARTWCATCPVRKECAEHARSRPEPFGVWGGATELERYIDTVESEPIARQRRGPDPTLNDDQLARLFDGADPSMSAVDVLQTQTGIGPSSAYKYAARAVTLGLAERRGRRLFPRHASGRA
jgi:WhiB family transcriptional regulator, redox-sensing transcriptional regulator